MTAHSNHILDSINSSDSISIFSVKKRDKSPVGTADRERVPDFVVENLASGHENILRLLGVTTTFVYLSNCVIWVDGITDKIYLQHYIAEYLMMPDLDERYKPISRFKEGINYSFALTGGEAIVQFDFDDAANNDGSYLKIIVNMFCSKSIVIVDNDFNRNEDRKAAMQKKLGDRFVVLPVPEIEKLLPPEVIDATIKSWPTVKKASAGNELPLLTKSDLDLKKIGVLIDDKVLCGFSNIKQFAASNGNLKSGDKYEFCTRALSRITSNNIS